MNTIAFQEGYIQKDAFLRSFLTKAPEWGRRLVSAAGKAVDTRPTLPPASGPLRTVIPEGAAMGPNWKKSVSRYVRDPLGLKANRKAQEWGNKAIEHQKKQNDFARRSQLSVSLSQTFGSPSPETVRAIQELNDQANKAEKLMNTAVNRNWMYGTLAGKHMKTTGAIASLPLQGFVLGKAKNLTQAGKEPSPAPTSDASAPTPAAASAPAPTPAPASASASAPASVPASAPAHGWMQNLQEWTGLDLTNKQHLAIAVALLLSLGMGGAAFMSRR